VGVGSDGDARQGRWADFVDFTACSGFSNGASFWDGISFGFGRAGIADFGWVWVWVLVLVSSSV
jgi:hypothetical protein